MDVWGSPGDALNFGYHSGVLVGSKVDLVADIISAQEDSILVSLYPGGQRAVLLGGVVIPAECTSVSVFDATLVGSGSLLCFLADKPDEILFHKRCCRSDFTKMVEFCAGMGIGIYGFATAGMETVVAVEWSKPMAETFELMHPGVPVICGDVNARATVKEVYRLHPSSAVLMAGFSCQPFSMGGMMRGANDQRSNTLAATLKAGCMLRSLVIILECVQEAGRNSMVRQQIEAFRDQCKFHLTEVVLALDSVWVSKRTRWWAVLAAPFVGPVGLPVFPLLHSPSVPRDLLTGPMDLDSSDLAQLELRGDELDAFLQYVPCLAKMFLPGNVKGPTALHSWGSQVVGCECGCRTAGFSHETLCSKGLYGILFPVPGDPHPTHPEVPRVRHPHPTEVAVLCWVPEMVWPASRRLCLAGLGQQASPIHTAWL